MTRFLQFTMPRTHQRFNHQMDLLSQHFDITHDVLIANVYNTALKQQATTSKENSNLRIVSHAKKLWGHPEE